VTTRGFSSALLIRLGVTSVSASGASVRPDGAGLRLLVQFVGSMAPRAPASPWCSLPLEVDRCNWAGVLAERGLDDGKWESKGSGIPAAL
jgi:hypothetical protein